MTKAAESATGQIIDCWIPGRPTPKGRARHGQNKKTGKPFTVTPKRTVLYENWVAYHVREAAKGVHFDGPILMGINAFLQMPKGKITKAHLLHYPAKTPDFDNLEKAALDGITQAGAWRDDCLVCDCRTCKRWAGIAYPDGLSSHEPGVSIHMEPLPTFVVRLLTPLKRKAGPDGPASPEA